MPQLLPRDKSGYLSHDTIAAIATALGGPVAIVRVSGPASFEALCRLTHSEASRRFEPRKLMRVALKDAQAQQFDDALVVRFAGPQSFTGEDSLELHIHGGVVTATQLMEILASYGIRQSLPGEFSFRAVRNGKMNLSQAEATADLIAATNEGAATLALEKMAGAQSRLVQEMAEELRTLTMLGEVGIDFADQDVDEVSLGNLQNRLGSIRSKLERLKGSYSRGQRLQEGVGVAFVGLPNAGKSSFFNALLGEDRSIVSELAGTTRDVVRERLTLRGPSGSVTLRMADTAGLRDADDRIEKMGIERTQRAAQEADFLILVVDASAPDQFTQLQDEWQKLSSPAARTFGILTKADLLPKDSGQAVRENLRAFGVQKWAETSAVSGAGIHEAAQEIAEFAEKWIHREKGEVLLTRLEHLQAVGEALEHLERGNYATEIDLFASDLRQALNSLSPLMGETPADDILGRIFSNFCIGK